MVESGKKVDAPEKGIVTFAQKINKVVDFVEVWVLIIIIAALTILLLANVISRKFFGGIFWAEEVTTLLIQVITFIGMSYGVRKARHIRMGAIFDLVGEKWPKIQKVMIYVISVYSAVIMFLMTSYAWNALVVTRGTIQHTPALGIPYWYIYIFVIIGFGMSGINYIRTIFKNIKEPDVWISPEQKGEYEDEVC
jgi:TRAP-type C4-dicarboxylate transport system permease small subunit